MRQSKTGSGFLTKFILLVGGLLLLAAAVSTAYLLYNIHLLDKLWKIMQVNWVFWVFVVLGVLFALWVKRRNPRELTWPELGLQLGSGVLILLGTFGSVVFFAGNFDDYEIWNGHVTQATYVEGWTEVVESCDENGENCSDSDYYHSPEYYQTLSTGDRLTIGRDAYLKIQARFGNRIWEDLDHLSEALHSNGGQYVTVWDGENDSLIPAAIKKPYVNFVKASGQWRRQRSGDFENLLLDYPSVYEGVYGHIETDRVLTAGVSVPSGWQQELDAALDQALVRLGSAKQVNLLVYLVNSRSNYFVHDLQQHWHLGKKNDVVLVIGVTEFPHIQWTEVMIFAGNENLKAELSKAVFGLETLTPASTLAETFITQVDQGFERVPMAKYEHLLYEVSIPIWAYLLIGLMNLVSAGFVSLLLTNNRVRA